VKNFLRSCRGLSLLEMLMACVLSAVILVPVYLSSNLAVQSWDEDSNNSEVLQHARVTMQRIMSELRYSPGIVNRDSPDILKFYTRTLLNNDWQPEIITYERKDAGGGMYTLYRNVDAGEENAIAGTSGYIVDDNIVVSVFEPRYFKIVGTAVQELAVTDPNNLVDLVQVKLTLAKGAKTVSLCSRVKLRNH